MITTAGAIASFWVLMGTLVSAYLVPHKKFFDMPYEGWRESWSTVLIPSMRDILDVIATGVFITAYFAIPLTAAILPFAMLLSML